MSKLYTIYASSTLAVVRYIIAYCLLLFRRIVWKRLVGLCEDTLIRNLNSLRELEPNVRILLHKIANYPQKVGREKDEKD